MSFLNTGIKVECCGCRACENICPKRCISIIEDEDGFSYPHIDNSNCINCRLCEKTCPQNYHRYIDKQFVKAYVGVHKDNSVVFNSSSGGAFMAICNEMVKSGYIVYGANFDCDLKVLHNAAFTIEDCEKFRKSKYIQSNMNNVYCRIYNDILSGNKVLFSGTPCQVAAVYSFLACKNVSISITRNMLFTISILCHGVPNQRIFDKYIHEIEISSGKKVKDYIFRYKGLVNGKHNSRSAMICYNDDSIKIVDMKSDPFLKGYYKRLFYRSACGECHFTRQDRISDITLADAWKIERVYPELNPLNGVSLILSASEQAQKIINKISYTMKIREIDSNWALNSQAILRKPTILHDNRELFFKLNRKITLKNAVRYSTIIIPWSRIIRVIKSRFNSMTK